MRELGRIELRDVGNPETVHCLVGARLAEVDAQYVMGATAARTTSLPRIDDDLVGRTREIAAVLDAVAAHPVVSIVGVGGMGKTRLALESAAASDVSEGVWWCDLSTATNAAAVPATVLAAIDARQSVGRSAAESVVDFLAMQRALVVFDNCEHVVDAARCRSMAPAEIATRLDDRFRFLRGVW